jgi:hypothetical protein
VRALTVMAVLAALALGGCGGSSKHDKAVKRLTVPAYGIAGGGVTSTTITVTAGTPAYCRRDAEAFTRDAVSFLEPFPSDADQYRVAARLQFIDFKAHQCDVAILRNAFSRLTGRQRRSIVSGLGFLGETGRKLTRAARN